MGDPAARAFDARASIDETNRETVLIGLVGRGIGQSRSPRLHEVEAAHNGIRCVYRLLDTDAMGEPRPRFEEVLRAAEIAGFAGLNVTYPYKREAMRFLHEVSDPARMVGAVNTIVLRDGKRRGHNTDYWGFAESFRRDMDGAARDVVLLLGAGGAGGAVANALLDNGVGRLEIFDVNPEAARGLADTLSARVGADRASATEDLARSLAAADGVVNATPVGMAKLPGSPAPTELLSDRLWVADIVYFPIETELLRAARQKGCRTLCGSGMAVFQAVRAFEHFTGLRPDHERMKGNIRVLHRVRRARPGAEPASTDDPGRRLAPTGPG